MFGLLILTASVKNSKIFIQTAKFLLNQWGQIVILQGFPKYLLGLQIRKIIPFIPNAPTKKY